MFFIKHTRYFFIIISCLVVLGIKANSTTTQKMEVKQAYENWIKAVTTAKGDTSPVLKLYAKDAILIPTLSPELRFSANQLNTYFKRFTMLPNLQAKTDQLIIRMFNNIAIASGRYTFIYNSYAHYNTQIEARFTFVFEKIKGNWLIIEQHSSAEPIGIG